LIQIRRARTADAPGIAGAHVSSWRSAYPGMLPDAFLAKLSVARQAAHYDRLIRIGLGVHVAVISGPQAVAAPPVLGFSSAVRARNGQNLAEGEVQSLYVLDDWKEHGIGRQLLRASAQHLAAQGCRSVFAWVLRDNPAAYFYQHLGGKPIATSMVRVGGEEFSQTAYAWDPIGLLLDVDA
jgi:GNAT superfamily N-acetyltransferase